jgi:hypothetical protein
LRAHGLSHKESQETRDNPKECNVVSGMGGETGFSLNDGVTLHGKSGVFHGKGGVLHRFMASTWPGHSPERSQMLNERHGNTLLLTSY